MGGVSSVLAGRGGPSGLPGVSHIARYVPENQQLT